MPDDEPRFDLAGNPLPPKTASAAPSLRPSGPAAPSPAYGGSQAYVPGFAPPEPNRNGAKIGLGIGGVLLVLILASVVLLTPKHTPVPTAYTKFAAADSSFSCDLPSGWVVTPAASGGKMSDGSESTVGGVLCQQNSAKVDITTDTYATLVAYDVVANNSDPQSLTGSKAGVLHKQWHKRIAAEHKGYHETQVTDYESPMGDVRLAEWTGAGNALGFGGSLHGYRISLDGGGGKTAEVVCCCLDSDWPSLKPAFRHVLGTLTAGGAAGQEPAAPSAP